MKILALEPFYAGSHKSFLDDWVQHSKHQWSVIGLPGYKWKWRMRHSPLTLSEMVKKEIKNGNSWDMLFCSDMLSLHEFIGFVPELARIPTVIYFHENQITYPVRNENQRDHHFAYSNFLSAIKADEVWFNSHYHKNDFLQALEKFLSKMPDYQHLEKIDELKIKSKVEYLGINQIKNEKKTLSRENPLHFIWAARWEFDKNPEALYEAFSIIKEKGYGFKLSILGERYKESPEVFDRIKNKFSTELIHFGYLESYSDYMNVLAEADVFISTAKHEFFGVSCVEAMSQGCLPLVPQKLAYPETVGLLPGEVVDNYFYDGSVDELVKKIISFIKKVDESTELVLTRKDIISSVSEFSWSKRALAMDENLENLLRKRSS